MESVSSPGLFDVLSDRELQVLSLVAEDKTDREIAGHLAITERTVRAHVSRIIQKLGVASRVGAAVAFVEWRIRAEPLTIPVLSEAQVFGRNYRMADSRKHPVELRERGAAAVPTLGSGRAKP